MALCFPHCMNQLFSFYGMSFTWFTNTACLLMLGRVLGIEERVVIMALPASTDLIYLVYGQSTLLTMLWIKVVSKLFLSFWLHMYSSWLIVHWSYICIYWCKIQQPYNALENWLAGPFKCVHGISTGGHTVFVLFFLHTHFYCFLY